MIPTMSFFMKAKCQGWFSCGHTVFIYSGQKSGALVGSQQNDLNGHGYRLAFIIKPKKVCSQ